MTMLHVTEEPDDGSYPPDDELNEDMLEEVQQRHRGRGAVPRGRSSRLLAKERQRRALELRKAGATYDAIADTLGYADHTGARAAVVKAMESIVTEPAQELRTLQLERYNHMLMVYWSKAMGGDIQAANMVITIQDRINKLQGLEAPQQTQVSLDVAGAVLVIDGNKDDYIAHMMRMAGVEEQEAKELPSGLPELTTGDDDIIDAEIIEPVKPSGRRRMISKEGSV